jgi:uncharacterized protein YutE (UPF0331/DUF86 family)
VEIIEVLLQYQGMKMKSKRYGVKRAIQIAIENEFDDGLHVLKHGRGKNEKQKEGFFAKLRIRQRVSHR